MNRPLNIPISEDLCRKHFRKRKNFLVRSGRISSVYIVGRWSLVVGHTFSKFVNLECVGVLVC